MDTITKIDLSSNSSANNSGAVPASRVPLEENNMSPKVKIIVPLIVVGILAGLLSGYVYARKNLLIASGGATQVLQDDGSVKVGQVVGAADEAAFKDKAEGIIQPGGTGGEGSHHLVRGDNASQWVYITSSVIDLDQYVGHKVTIWGETLQGKKAGWLMDVARLKVLELNAAQVNAITEE